MVKADAYGHGAALVADTLLNFSAYDLEGPVVDALAVATLDEAEQLRPILEEPPDIVALKQDSLGADMWASRTRVPLLVLRPVENVYLGRERDRLECAARAGYVLTVNTSQGAADLNRIASRCNQRVPVQVMIDTGIAREGCPLSLVDAVVSAIESQSNLNLVAICTHFVSSEEPDNPFTTEQLRRFQSATAHHVARHPALVRHAANSGAIFYTPGARLDMVRPGISIYGIDPTCRPNLDRALRPVLKWTAPLLTLRNLNPGDTVGYNQTWKADLETRVGLVPVGYADGYLRSCSNRAIMLLNGKKCPVIGRISMDYATIDLSAVPEASVGDEVTVLDCDPLSPASAYALAKIAQTIPYEIFCHIGQRVRRVAVEPAEKEKSQELGETRQRVA